jgi:hypothetical protein
MTVGAAGMINILGTGENEVEKVREHLISD